MFRRSFFIAPFVYCASISKTVAAFGIVRPPTRKIPSSSLHLADFSSSSTTTTTTTSSSSPMTTTTVQGPPLPSQDTTTKRLFLVRHGEVINPGGDRPVFYGSQDVPLSKLGQQEAQAAAAYLQQYQLSHFFCSPLKRAIYGAEQIAALQQQQQQDGGVTILKGFTELERGAWRGRTKDEIGYDLLARFDACDESVTPEGGESYPTLKARVMEALATALAQMQPGDAAAIVSHLQVTRSMLSEALGIPVHEMTQLPVATASVTCIDYTADNDQPSTVHFQSFKPDVGLKEAKDGAN